MAFRRALSFLAEYFNVLHTYSGASRPAQSRITYIPWVSTPFGAILKRAQRPISFRYNSQRIRLKIEKQIKNKHAATTEFRLG